MACKKDVLAVIQWKKESNSTVKSTAHILLHQWCCKIVDFNGVSFPALNNNCDSKCPHEQNS